MNKDFDTWFSTFFGHLEKLGFTGPPLEKWHFEGDWANGKDPDTVAMAFISGDFVTHFTAPTQAPPPSMVPIGFKVVVERQDGAISTWQDVFNKPPEDILLSVREQKGWGNGKVTEAYIEFRDTKRKYRKVFLDCKPLTKCLKISQ